jgi:sugar/nucleoside kinase (ribokinase family)
MAIPDYRTQDLERLTAYLAESVDVRRIVVHPIDCACMRVDGGFYLQQGSYCDKPVLTTGAGDCFNAGVAFGICSGMSADESLALGNAMSGYYVRNGRSGSLEEVIGD